MRGDVLVVDKDNDSLSGLPAVLREAGLQVTHVKNHDETRATLAQMDFSVVVAALEEHHAHKQTLLKVIKGNTPETEVVLVSRTATVDAAVRAMQMGAYNYLPLPENPSDLVIVIQKAFEKSQLQQELMELRHMIRGQQAMPMLIGKSAKMQALKREIARVAPLDCTVLIQGETGTGKEMVAKMVHRLSLRSDKRFLAVNTGAFNAELLANELFGHEQGAYTGAQRTKAGVFEATHQGTLLLDEIGEMPLGMQVQLLRVLQERTVVRVGGTEEIPVDVRLMAATHRDIEKEVERGRFRQDLFYRLNVFTLKLPALRERVDDIPLFCHYFIEKFANAFKKDVIGMDDEVLGILMAHPFPGNVRELENLIERAVVLCDGSTIEARHLPQEFHKAAAMTHHDVQTDEGLLPLTEVERRHILKVLEHVQHSKGQAAKILGIDRATLWRKLQRYGIDAE
ncbi:MAG: sigma-54-dependent transcriptional regulator [Halodesulfovibrio sp.]